MAPIESGAIHIQPLQSYASISFPAFVYIPQVKNRDDSYQSLSNSC